MSIVSRKFLAVCASVCLMCGLISCGGGGSIPTPTDPTAVYGGAATAGDVMVIKMDYPSTGKATITISESDGTLVRTEEMSYTLSGNKYTFTDSGENLITGFLVPDTMIAVQLPDDIIIAVEVDETIKTAADLDFVKDHEYVLTQFRHDKKGVKWVWSNVDEDGVITGHHANQETNPPTYTYDLQDPSTENDFTAGMDVDDLIYNTDTFGFNLTVADPEEGSETWTLYYTKAGLAVIDKGPLKGIRFNSLKGTTTNPADYGIALDNVYDTIFYRSAGEGDVGTSIGTVTVTKVEADAFEASVDDGRGEGERTIKAVAADEPWIGLFMIEGSNAVIQPIGEGAFVFAGKHEEWIYDYGVGVQR